jgi:penicillin-binding protein 1A
MRAAVENAKAGRVVEGGSSLTQQLAKVLFLTPERSMQRKMKEAVVALHIERQYSKEEILTIYCNQVYMGHNRYGVEAAARFFFGKHAADLSLDEAALIAGIPQRPNGYSPYRYHDAAIARRDHVLDRMRDAGFITPAEAAEAQARPLVPKALEMDDIALAPYFVEEVRQYLEQNYGERRLYHDGLNVHTTLDVGMQEAAETALRNGLLALDKRQGWRGAQENVLSDQPGTTLKGFVSPAWEKPRAIGDLVPGLVMAAKPRLITVRVGSLIGEVTRVPDWIHRGAVGDLYKTGDLGTFRVTSIDEGKGEIGLEIEQEPAVEGALIALDVRTGEVRALVGGWDFQRSKFDRAIQARRQTGSSFKPILYATALGNGFTAADSLFDEPIAITDPWTGKVYSPENYTKTYYGLTTLREALEQSRNPISVQLLQRIGPAAVIENAARLGLTTKLDPYPSLALGAFEETLIEMTSAFTAFADLGVVNEPYLINRIEDRDGTVVLRKNPVPRQALPPDVAYVTNYIMQGVVQYGTGRAARSLGVPLAGKTGTTDDFTDAWFLGFSPSIACGVWVGFDVKRTLGKNEVGAKAALPIWIEFMRSAIDPSEEGEFTRPPGIEFVTIDKDTGFRASDSCRITFPEAFLRGTAPVTYCSAKDHEVRALPYYLQKIYLGGGELPPMSSGTPPAGDPGDDATE